MKNLNEYIPWAIIFILLILLWFKGCGKGGDTNAVTIPEKKGSFPERENPIPVPATEKEYVYLTGKGKTDTIRVENPINIELLEKFEELGSNKDSLYADAIGEREYNIKEEDSLLITNNYIKAQGKVLKFQQSYTIKPKKITVKDKETVLRMLGGVEVGSKMELTDFAVKANLMLQNRKGSILSIGYDTENRIYAGYSFSIFNIRK